MSRKQRVGASLSPWLTQVLIHFFFYSTNKSVLKRTDVVSTDVKNGRANAAKGSRMEEDIIEAVFALQWRTHILLHAYSKKYGR